MTQVLCVAGARPNFMKIAPVMAALAETGIAAQLLHTGQHYDAAMSDSFFADLGIPHPDHHLEVGSGSHAVQTAEVMKRFEPVLESVQPQAVLVVGDVNSTIACALVAAKRGVRVIHVEAGLRSYDRGMPEEINRVLTDQLSDLLFITEKSALANLQREGIDPARVEFVGNVMIDTLYRNLEHAVPASQTLGTTLTSYAVLTLHRPSNVDDPATLAALARCGGRNQPQPAGGAALASPHAQQYRKIRIHGQAGWPAYPAALGVSGDAGSDARCQAGADRFRGHPGRNHRAGRALSYLAREHRAPDYDCRRDQYPGRS